MHPNTEARERAMNLLYEADTRAVSIDDLLGEQVLVPTEFVAAALRGISAKSEEVDRLIEAKSDRWSIDRLAVIDRAILRLATWELLASAEPIAVVISEAVDLAKKYSTKDSGRFVNGVLAAISNEVRQPPANFGR